MIDCQPPSLGTAVGPSCDREELHMFSPDEISRNARAHVGHLHREASVESSLRLVRKPYRARIAIVVRRFAAWIEPKEAAVLDSNQEPIPQKSR